MIYKSQTMILQLKIHVFLHQVSNHFHLSGPKPSWRSAPSNLGEPLRHETKQPTLKRLHLSSKNKPTQPGLPQPKKQEFTNRNFITLESVSLSVIFFGHLWVWFLFLRPATSFPPEGKARWCHRDHLCIAQAHHSTSSCPHFPPKPVAWPWLWRCSPQVTNQNHHLISTWRHGQVPRAAAVTWLGAAVLMCTWAPPKKKRASALKLCPVS